MNAHSIKISGRALDRAGNRALQARIRRQKQEAKRDALRDAAPELLAALKMAERFMRGFEDDLSQGIGPELTDMRRAIALAEGRFLCSISSRSRKR